MHANNELVKYSPLCMISVLHATAKNKDSTVKELTMHLYKFLIKNTVHQYNVKILLISAMPDHKLS